MAPKQFFRFHTLPHLCVAGGTAAGEVELDFPLLLSNDIQEVIIKLRGSVHTDVRGRYGTMQETSSLIQSNISLWKRGPTDPVPGPHTHRIPFQFALPSTLPPSFDFAGMDTKAIIRYFLEVVGVRSGALRMNRRRIFPLAVVPSDPHGAELHSALGFGWDGPWTTIRQEKQVRKGPWGDYATAMLELSLPTIDQFPLFTPIPYSMKVITFSKTMRRKDASPAKAIFPAPPLHAKDIDFALRRTAHVCAQAWENSFLGERVCCLGGICQRDSPVKIILSDIVWIASPDDPEKGKWKQEGTFSSVMELKCSPTFRIDTITNEYSLSVAVYFGLFNTVTIDVPVVVVVSNMASSADLDIEVPPLPSPAYRRRVDRLRSRPLNSTAQAWSSEANNVSISHSFPAHPIPNRHASLPPPSYPRELLQSSSSGAQSPALDLPPSYWTSTPDDWDRQSQTSR